MAKLGCLCGQVIDLSSHPNENEYRVLSEPMLEAVIERILSVCREGTSAENLEKALYAIMYRGVPAPIQVYECTNCGRLAVFWHTSDAAPVLWYTREDGSNPSALLRDLVSRQGA